MAPITNRQVADFLEEFGVLLELNGANPFQVRAYASAARTIDQLDRQVADLAARQELTGIKGIGKGLAGLIAEFAQTGTAEEFESLRSALPPGLGVARKGWLTAADVINTLDAAAIIAHFRGQG